MKKIILVLGLVAATQLQTKAQQGYVQTTASLYPTFKSTSLFQAETSSKNGFSSGNNLPEKDYSYYMKKKKNMLTAGLVTLGAGLALSGVGLITASNSTSIDTDATAAILLIAGAASGIASIPLMIMATVYGHKAKLEFSNQKTGFGVPSNVSKNIAGITMSIPIGK